MKISRNWLQRYFDKTLPNAEAINEALTFNAFEIEEQEDDMMNVKVLPNRSSDCLCHLGIAKEISAILDIPLKNDPLKDILPEFKKNDELGVTIEDSKKCLRYIGTLVKGVKVGPSQDWLKEALESIGQRSINNIVDATNFVMLNIGQPLHAFDASKLEKKDGSYLIGVRGARDEEKITVLTGEEFTLQKGISLITDENAGKPIGIAGIKGGALAEIDDKTTDIIIESANFDGTSIRRSSQWLKLITDASIRFQNRPSAELCAYGMRDVLAIIKEVAGGEVITTVDIYPSISKKELSIEVSLQKINGVLGSDFSKEEVGNVLKRLSLNYEVTGDIFKITPSFERCDLTIPEDIAEEIGRIIGYDRIPSVELPAISEDPDSAQYRGIEKIKDFLVDKGFTEISTQTFATKGDIMLANPLDKTKPALRKSLKENMQEALTKAKQYAPLVLPPNQKPKLFEIGTVFTKDGEKLEIETSEPVSDIPEIKEDKEYVPQKYSMGAYQAFSVYPFIVRDIAFWAPSDIDVELTKSNIRKEAGELLVRIDQFDRFEKEGKLSLAFRLVFQSFDRTLTDDETNGIMEKIAKTLSTEGFEVR